VSAELGTRDEVTTRRGRLEYWSRGDGPPIVFLHGLGVNALHWRKVVAELAGEYRCIVPELPLGGHRIPMPREADLTPYGLADLVDAFLEALDLTDVTLVGNDTGGAILQLVATRHPERIGRLVLTPSDAFEHFLPPPFGVLKAGAFVPGVPWLTVQSMRIERLRYSPIAFGRLVNRRIPREITDSYARAALQPLIRRDIAKVLRGVHPRYTLEAAERLRSFDKPVLIAWTRDDPVFLFRHAERFAQLLPNAALEVIEDSRGFVPEDQPVALAGAIRSFLSKAA
jgi:pimeloyl-ACP methyl ester carboxylesterase